MLVAPVNTDWNSQEYNTTLFESDSKRYFTYPPDRLQGSSCMCVDVQTPGGRSDTLPPSSCGRGRGAMPASSPGNCDIGSGTGGRRGRLGTGAGGHRRSPGHRPARGCLGTDPQLPRDAARQLVDAMAHPLNRPSLLEFSTALLLGFSGGEHTTWRKAASDVGCSDIKKFGVCLRAGGLAGVPGNGQNPLG